MKRAILILLLSLAAPSAALADDCSEAPAAELAPIEADAGVALEASPVTPASAEAGPCTRVHAIPAAGEGEPLVARTLALDTSGHLERALFRASTLAFDSVRVSGTSDPGVRLAVHIQSPGEPLLGFREAWPDSLGHVAKAHRARTRNLTSREAPPGSGG